MFPSQKKYCTMIGLSRSYWAFSDATSSGVISTPRLRIRAILASITVPGGSWMMTNTITLPINSTGIIISTRRST